MTARDDHGRFVSSPSNGIEREHDIIDAEVIEDAPGTDLVLPGARGEIETLPEPSGLLQTLWNDVEQAALLDFDADRAARLIEVIERLYPELHTAIGRRRAFVWPECPVYEPQIPIDETAVGTFSLADQTVISRPRLARTLDEVSTPLLEQLWAERR